MYALFNIEKQFIGYSENIIESSSIHCVNLPSDKSDPSKWYWKGDMDNGRMVSYTLEGYPEEEIILEEKLFKKMEESFPLHVQSALIIKQLHHTAKITNSLLEEYEEMSDLVSLALEKLAKRQTFAKKKMQFHSQNSHEKSTT
jgi:hypothetical protein